MQGTPIQLGVGAQLPLFNQGPSMEARTPINEALLTGVKVVCPSLACCCGYRTLQNSAAAKIKSTGKQQEMENCFSNSAELLRRDRPVFEIASVWVIVVVIKHDADDKELGLAAAREEGSSTWLGVLQFHLTASFASGSG